MKTNQNVKKIVIVVVLLLLIGIGIAFFNKNEKVYVRPIQTDLPSQTSSVVIRGNEAFETLAPEAVPKEVSDMVKKFYPEAQIVEVTRKTDIPDGDCEYRMKIDFKGKILQSQIDVEPQNNNRIKGEINQRVSTNEIPANIIQTFKKYAPDIVLQDAERRVEFDNENWQVFYRWDCKNPDMRISITESSSNQDKQPAVEIRTRLNIAAVSKSLIDTVNKNYNNPQIDPSVEKRIRNEIVSYRFKIRTADGKKHDVEMSESGEVLRFK